VFWSPLVCVVVFVGLCCDCGPLVCAVLCVLWSSLMCGVTTCVCMLLAKLVFVSWFSCCFPPSYCCSFSSHSHADFAGVISDFAGVTVRCDLRLIVRSPSKALRCLFGGSLTVLGLKLTHFETRFENHVEPSGRCLFGVASKLSCWSVTVAVSTFLFACSERLTLDLES
jgi:hypothetical protein